MNRFWRYALLNLVLICCVVALPALAEWELEGFQQGKIYAVEKVTRRIIAPRDVARDPLSAPVTRYHIHIQVGDDVYVYQDEVETGQRIPWEVGQSPQVKIVGNSIQVKRITGEIDTYAIVSAGTASADRDP